jgi:hypothetical protein
MQAKLEIKVMQLYSGNFLKDCHALIRRGYVKRVIVGFFGFMWLATALAAPTTPKEIDGLIESKGASFVRENYFSCWESTKATGYNLVETGSEDWLRIAVRLVKDADGCYAMGLQTSIALAQIKNPEKVLKLVDSGANLEAAYICVPFMADEVDPKKMRAQIKVLDRLERALNKVKDKNLEEKKKKCLSVIQPLRKYISDQLKVSGSK